MTKEPFMIKLSHETENEDGSATYSFDISEDCRKSVLEVGLKFMLYCGVAEVDMQDAYDWILSHVEKEKQYES